MPAITSILAFLTIFIGYIIQTSILQYIYYYKRSSSIDKWKCQPKQTQSLGQFYIHPIFSNKPNRGKYHRLFTLINLLLASSFAYFITELSYQEITKFEYFEFNSVFHAIYIVIPQLLSIILYENIIEYYWHRLMHTKYCYKHLHKYHHVYKSPEPWDDLYIHPIEAFGYYCILYSPPLLFSIHVYTFIGYMIVMGLCGVIDHSGVRVEIVNVYNSLDHDLHHQKYDVNYGFPFIYMDILHKTYTGTFLGMRYDSMRARPTMT